MVLSGKKLDKNCPECGEKEVEEKTFYEYSEDIAYVKEYCNACIDHWKTIYARRTEEEKDSRQCIICSQKHLPHNNSLICRECDSKVFSYPYKDFALIKPGDTDVVYKHQTGGLMCTKVYVEGSYISLERPIVDGIELLPKLQTANYNYDAEDAAEIWKEIEEVLPFSFERVKAPENQYHNQEGLKWVKITSVNTKFRDDLRNLEGETVALFYPNSD